MTNKEIAEEIIQKWWDKNDISTEALKLELIEALDAKDKSFPITITKHEKCLFENHEPLEPSAKEIRESFESWNKSNDYSASSVELSPGQFRNIARHFYICGAEWTIEWLRQKGKRDE